MLDVLIIGGGPIGLACGIEAKRRGLSYLIIEKGTLVNSLYHYPMYMTFFSTSDRLEVGGIPFMNVQPKPNRNEAVEYYRRVTHKEELNIHLFEEVLDVQKQNDGSYTVTTSQKSYTAKNIVVATGFYGLPILMNIPGEDLPKVTHYYKDPAYYPFQKVLVVGANNSSVDAALETYRRGAEVTMVIRGEGIGERVKYWVKPDIENRIKEGSIKAYTHSSLIAIREKEVDIQTPDGMVTIENDFVLALTGYHPDFTLLHKLGIDLSEDEVRCPAYNPETMETNQKGMYLAGVVCGGMNTHKWFIENSRVHAEMIMSDVEVKSKK